jgi:ADP-heptose:LPS heptosyltransferase
VWEYYNQKCNLSQAFDIAINNKGVRDLPKPTLKLSREEAINGKFIVAEVRQKTKKPKTVVFQPYGRGVQQAGSIITDPSGRSFEHRNVVSIIKRLQKKYSVILMSEFAFDFEKEGLRDTISFPAGNGVPMRGWAGIIEEADLFLGCDSVGQHIAHAVGTPVVAVMGSTFGENVSYPNEEKFDILDMGEGQRIYDPIRITPDEEAARANDGIMAMNDKIEDVIMKSVDKFMNKYYRKPATDVVLPPEFGGPTADGCNMPEAAPSSNGNNFQLPMQQAAPGGTDVKIPAIEIPSKGFSVKK